jgi:DNA-directed RNA polymerase specialized sigma24 family protein
LTSEQFEALAELLRLREGVSGQAAQLVLVSGLSQAEAGRQTGLSTAGVGNAVRRVRRGLELAKLAASS